MSDDKYGYFFFFFQAEDGIRDRLVTGVQTCALPIYNVFVGDTIFMPDVGTARTDFPGGSAQDLFDSIQNIFALPLETNLYTAHDYPTEDRIICCKSTVGQQRTNNMMIGGDITKEQFIHARKAKDKLSDIPNLLLPAIQINIQAGNLPVAEENNVCYIKIPVNRL